MDHEADELSDAPGVTVRCNEDPDTSIRLLDRYVVDEDETAFTIETHADGLHARIRAGVAKWDRDGDMADFLRSLANDFRGWSGRRAWHTNQLTLVAVFHSGGHVELTWTLRPWSSHRASWETSITTWVEGGEQLTALSAEVSAFFGSFGAA